MQIDLHGLASKSYWVKSQLPPKADVFLQTFLGELWEIGTFSPKWADYLQAITVSIFA
jgi:hypothetical protein